MPRTVNCPTWEISVAPVQNRDVKSNCLSAFTSEALSPEPDVFDAADAMSDDQNIYENGESASPGDFSSTLDQEQESSDYASLLAASQAQQSELDSSDASGLFSSSGDLQDLHLDQAIDKVIMQVVGRKIGTDSPVQSHRAAVVSNNSYYQTYKLGAPRMGRRVGTTMNANKLRNKALKFGLGPQHLESHLLSKYRKAKPETPELRERCLAILEEFANRKRRRARAKARILEELEEADAAEPVITVTETRSEAPEAVPPRIRRIAPAPNPASSSAQQTLQLRLPNFGVFRVKGLDTNGNVELELVSEEKPDKPLPEYSQAAIVGYLMGLFHGVSEYYCSTAVARVAFEHDSIVDYLCRLASSVDSSRSISKTSDDDVAVIADFTSTSETPAPPREKPRTLNGVISRRPTTVVYPSDSNSTTRPSVNATTPSGFVPCSPFTRVKLAIGLRTRPTREQLSAIISSFAKSLKLSASLRQLDGVSHRQADVMFYVATCYTVVHNRGPVWSVSDVRKIRELTGCPEVVTKHYFWMIRNQWLEAAQKLIPKAEIKSENALFFRLFTMGHCCCATYQPCFLDFRDVVRASLSKDRADSLQRVCVKLGLLNFFG